jgi:hypothetical protein
VSEFEWRYRSESGYGTGPGDEAAIERLSRAVQRTEVYMIGAQSDTGITTDVLLHLDDWR